MRPENVAQEILGRAFNCEPSLSWFLGQKIPNSFEAVEEGKKEAKPKESGASRVFPSCIGCVKSSSSVLARMAHSSAKVSVQKQKKIGVRKKKTTAATGGAVGNRMVEEERARLLVLEDRLREFRSLLLRLQQSLDRVEHRLSAIEDCVKNIRTAHS